MKNEIRPLCLSFWTPPLIRPQSILIGKMVSEWISQGINPVIITYKVCDGWNIDAPIYKIPQYKINKYLSKFFLIRVLLRYYYFQKLFKQAKKVIKRHNINIIFSFSNPQDSNILGMMLKKKLEIKFISHFSDPWIDNPYKFFNGLSKIIMLKREKDIIQNSDQIIFTNDQAKKLVMKKYPNNYLDKARVIPHCYDLKDYPVINKQNKNKFIFSYIGAFYKKRNPEVLFKVLKNILNKNIKKKIELQLIGTTNDYAGYSLGKINELLIKYKIKNIVQIIPPVSYQKSLAFMKNSDCLIVIDANFANSPFLPSKLIDYAGSKTPIVAISPKDSPTAQFLVNLGYQSFSYEQINDLTKYLSSLINEDIQFNINDNYLQKFDVKNTTIQLINQFKKVLNL